jgi:hypothetical protein
MGATDQALVAPTTGRVRGVLVGALVALSCLAAAATGLTFWVHYTVLDTDGYMGLVGPVGRNPEAIDRLSGYLAEQVVAATDLQTRTAEALPPDAAFLAGPITTAVTGYVADGTNRLLSGDRAYDLWLRANRLAHEKIAALLRGEATYASIEGDDVRLDTLPLISQALVWLDEQSPGPIIGRLGPPVIEPGTDPAVSIERISAWAGRPLPPDFGQVTLVRAEALSSAQRAVRLFDAMRWVLIAVTAALAAASLGLSRRRLRTLIALGAGVVVVLILTRAIVRRASDALVEGLDGPGLGVARDVTEAALGPLTTITIWIVIAGALVSVVAWIAGRTDLQRAVVDAARRLRRRGEGALPTDSPVARRVKRRAALLHWAGLVVGLALVALLDLSWLGLALVVLFTLLYEAAVSAVAGEWPFVGRDQAAAPD